MSDPQSPSIREHKGPWEIEVLDRGRWQSWRYFKKGQRTQMQREWLRLKQLGRDVRVQMVMDYES